MVKKYKIFLVLIALGVVLGALAQGCGSSTATSTTHAVYGTTS